jgi:membrane associated rhomboid family serine protease
MSDFQQQVQLHLPSPSKLFSPVVTSLLILMVIGYALIHYATDFTLQYLAISANGVFSGKIWQVITYSFINSCPWNFIFNLFVVLFIGSMVERQWRSGGFFLLCLSISVICGVGWVLVSFILRQGYIGIGTDAIAYGLIAAFGLLFRKQRFWFYFFVMEAQMIAILIIGLGLIIGIANPVSWVWVSGAGVSYLYIKGRWAFLDRDRSPVGSSAIRDSGFVDID